MADQPSSAADRPQRGRSVRGARALESLEFGSRTTGKQAAARSRLVRRLRIALPVVAVVLIAAFFLNTRSNSVDQAFLKDFETLNASTEELHMANPRFAGVDDDGKPFEITARSAKQAPNARDIVELEDPRAVQGGDDDASVVTAKRGVYSSERNILELQNDVTLRHRFGAETYVLRSPAATVLIKDEIVSSDAGVGAEGAKGEAIAADRMTAYRGENKVVFEGNVSMRIFPNSKNAAGLREGPPATALDGAARDENEADQSEDAPS